MLKFNFNLRIDRNNIRRVKHASLADVSESVSRWIDSEVAENNPVETPTPRSAMSRMYHSVIRKNWKANDRESIVFNNNGEQLKRTHLSHNFPVSPLPKMTS